jgi:hypothetical protein
LILLTLVKSKILKKKFKNLGVEKENFYERMEKILVKENKNFDIEASAGVFFEIKIKIPQKKISEVIKKLHQLGFKGDEDKIQSEKDFIFFSSYSPDLFRIREKEGNNKKYLLLVFHKKINNLQVSDFVIKIQEENFYGEIFKELKNLTPKTELNTCIIEKRRSLFYDKKENFVSIDIDVKKEENGQITNLGNFIEITTKSKKEILRLIEEFRVFGEVTTKSYYEMQSDFVQNIRS